MGEGFPLWSLAPMAWKGREPLQDWIYLSVPTFSDPSPSPFLLYPEIHNSDWGEYFAQIFLVKLAFLRQKKSINRLTGGPEECQARPGGWARPLSPGHLGHRFAYIWRSVTPIGLKPLPRFFSEYYLSCSKRRASTALRVAHEGRGRAQGGQARPLPRDHLGHRLAWVFLPEFSKYSKNKLRPFLSRLDSV